MIVIKTKKWPDDYELIGNSYKLYCAMNYSNKNCVCLKEFTSDVHLIGKIKNLLKQHNTKKQLKDRLIINYIILIFNTFEPKAAIKCLYFKTPKEYHQQLNALLKFCGRLHDDNIYINKLTTIKLKDIMVVDEEFYKFLDKME